jgi:hypothetical protein
MQERVQPLEEPAGYQLQVPGRVLGLDGRIRL